MSTRLLTLLIVLALGAACGTDESAYVGGSVTDTGTSGDGSGATCERHADCRGGEICRNGTCEAVDAQVCEPGTGSCEGNVAVVCDALGAAMTRLDCADELCVAGDLGATCLPASCTEGDSGCVDGHTAYTCPAGSRTLSPCPAGTGCLAGECVDAICEPGERSCDGNTVVVCGPAGVSETAVPCAAQTECAGASSGCTCIAGSCVVRTCTPNERACDGADVVACDSTGETTSVVETCVVPETCRAGVCIDEGCEPGTSSCAGEIRLSCSVEAGTIVETDCRDSEGYCHEIDETTAGCVGWECVPGTSSCDRSGANRVVCDDRGTSFELVACGSGETCSSGACVPRVCEPGARTCTDGDVYECASNGAGFALAERCAVDATCEGGVCVGGEPECSTAGDCPSPRDRCEGSVLVSYSGNGVCSRGVCDYEPVESRTDCASSGRTCSSVSLACVTPTGETCTNDDDCVDGVCVSGNCADCRADADCGGVEMCIDGTCTDCPCPSGFICDAAGDCVEGDPTVCASDAECQDLAEDLGASPDGAACDEEVGCFVRGVCDGGMLPSGVVDPFGAPCPEGLTCDFVLDLLGGTFVNVCKGCDPEDAGSCRDGEVCVPNSFGFPDATPYCTTEGGGGGLPFPFP